MSTKILPVLGLGALATASADVGAMFTAIDGEVATITSSVGTTIVAVAGIFLVFMGWRFVKKVMNA